MKIPKNPNRIIAINPGAKQCGIVVVTRNPKIGTLIYKTHALVRRPTDYEHRSPNGLDRWVDYISDFIDAASTRRSVVAVESINAQSFPGQVSVAARVGAIENAYVSGQLIGKYGAVSVRSGPPSAIQPGHGRRPLKFYPKALIGENEVRGQGQLKYCRAAYDIGRVANDIISTLIKI